MQLISFHYDTANLINNLVSQINKANQMFEYYVGFVIPVHIKQTKRLWNTTKMVLAFNCFDESQQEKLKITKRI